MPYGNSKRTKSIWRVATARAKKSGFNDFSAGSAGAVKRSRIAEAIDAKGGVKPKRGKR